MHLQSVLKLLRRDLVPSWCCVPRRCATTSTLLELQHAEMRKPELSLIVVLESTHPVAYFAESIDYLSLCED